MVEREVPRIKTPLTMPAFAAGVRAAWALEMGSDAPRRAVAVLYGQFVIETGGVECWNWNPGNVKWAPGCGFNWMDLPAWEVVDGKRVNLPPGDPGRRFRAYDDLSTGLRSHIRFLYAGAGGRYAGAWGLVVRGEARAFALELKRARYYTGPEDIYAARVAASYAQFMAHGPMWEERDRDFEALEALCAFLAAESRAECERAIASVV